MPQTLISYDLTGPQSKRDEFLENMLRYGWSDHIQRGLEFERLPNTTLISNFDAAEAVRTFTASANKASLDGAGNFAVTHWTITGFEEINGGSPKPSASKAAAVLKTTRDPS